MNLVPICIETDTYNNQSNFKYPIKSRKENKDIFNCIRSFEYPSQIRTYYIIDPDRRPIPYGSVLYCAELDNNRDKQTIDLKTEYDPYNVDSECIRFIAWKNPQSMGEYKNYQLIPLYIFNRGNSIFVSETDSKPSDDYIENEYSPIFVFKKKEIEHFNILNFKKGNIIVNFPSYVLVLIVIIFFLFLFRKKELIRDSDSKK